jgi:hypothetical protein
MADSKIGHFSKSPILNIFLWKFTGLVLGLVGLNVAKGIKLAQPIRPWGCPTKAQKWPKKTKNPFFDCFWAYVGQPHDHIGWATSMPFASFNSTNPRTSPLNFHKKISRIGDFKKWLLKNDLFLSRPVWFFFASFPWKLAQIYMVERMAWNFDVLPGFQKIPCYA